MRSLLVLSLLLACAACSEKEKKKENTQPSSEASKAAPVVVEEKVKETPEPASPYSKEGQKAKEKEIIKEYTDSHNSVGKSVGIANMEETESPTKADDIDGITPPHSPDRKEAAKPVEPSARKAQKQLNNEITTGQVEKAIGTKELGEELTTEPGKPENLKQLATDEQEARGHNAPGPKAKDVAPYGSPVVGGIVP